MDEDKSHGLGPNKTAAKNPFFVLQGGGIVASRLDDRARKVM
jgi:hypothetical protein